MKHTLAIGATFLSASLAFAQINELNPTGGTAGKKDPRTTTPSVTEETGPANRTGLPHVRRASSIMGATVILRDETLGKVTDLIIADNGVIEYLVVNQGNDYLAVPWRAGTLNDQRSSFLINNRQLTRDRLRDLTFPRDRWPNFEDAAWGRTMRSIWGDGSFRTEVTPRTDTTPGVLPKNRNNLNESGTPAPRKDVPPDTPNPFRR